MGYNVDYQAIPSNCALLDLVKGNPKDAMWILGAFNRIATGYLTGSIPRNPNYLRRDDIINEMKKVVDQNPGIETRHFWEPGRTFDVFDYILSQERRTTRIRERDDIVSKLNWGSIELYPPNSHLYPLSIGEFLRYVPASEVHASFAYLDQVKFDMLWEQIDPVAMYEAGVYKWDYSDKTDKYREEIRESLEGFRNFYASASQHNEIVLVRCL